MKIWNVNNKPTIEKFRKYDKNKHIFYRVQDKDYELGTQSWGMIYSSAEEAREAYEEEGLNPDDAVLNGKSAWGTAKEMYQYSFSRFDSETDVILILSGNYVEEGHDGEDVVDVDEVLEVWDLDEFIDMVDKMDTKSNVTIADLMKMN